MQKQVFFFGLLVIFFLVFTFSLSFFFFFFSGSCNYGSWDELPKHDKTKRCDMNEPAYIISNFYLLLILVQ